MSTSHPIPATEPTTGHEPGRRTIGDLGRREPPRWGAVAAPLAVSADPVTTYLAVRGGAAEGHPLWAVTIEQVGLGPAMTIRLLVGLVLVAAIVVAVEHEGAPVTGWALRALAAVFALVAAWNLGVWIAA